MRPPLAMLRRHNLTVLLQHGAAPFDVPPGLDAGIGRVDLHSARAAVAYLQYWKNDAGAMLELRNALYRFRHAPVAAMSDADVIEAIAQAVAFGDLSFTTEVYYIRRPATRIGGEALASQTAAAASTTTTASTEPSFGPPPPVLPLLEEVQVEGAQVLPEVFQTLEQLDLSMEQIELATVSLDPAPSGVPPISDALTDAGDSVTSTLDEL